MPPDAPPPPNRPKASPLGIVLFLAYLAIYAGFVWIAAFNGTVLSSRPFGGVNLAIIYGAILIVVPLILALVYLTWAGKAED
jgi:uncharacterized membrane protein (DUF485 family)